MQEKHFHSRSYRRLGPLGIKNGSTPPIKPQKSVKTIRAILDLSIEKFDLKDENYVHRILVFSKIKIHIKANK